MFERKVKLIEALKQERARFEKNGYNTLEHDITIEYLETGITDKNPDDFELLYAAMYDYNMLCLDYDV